MTKFCPLIKELCIDKECALWIEKTSSGKGCCAIVAIAKAKQ